MVAVRDLDGTRYALGQWDRSAFAAPPAAPRAQAPGARCSGPGGAKGRTGQRARSRRPGAQHRDVLLARGRLLPGQHLRDGLQASRPRLGVNYWGYDADAKRFRIIFFSNNGPFTEDGNRYAGEVVDGRLTFEGPARASSTSSIRKNVAVNHDGTICVAWWLRDEHGSGRPGCTTSSGELQPRRDDDRAACADEQSSPLARGGDLGGRRGGCRAGDRHVPRAC